MRGSELAEPLRRRQMVPEEIATRIMALVERGELVAGQRLPAERELAASLGVGRPSLREALRGLSLAGVVEIRHGAGVWISKLEATDVLGPLGFFVRLDRSTLPALFEARILLESGVAGLAAKRIRKAQVDRLRDCLSRAAAVVGDAEAFAQVDIEFHQLVFLAAANPFLLRVSESLAVLGRASRDVTAKMAAVRRRSLADHGLIVEAMARRDVAAAEQAMATHLRHVCDAYVRGAAAVAKSD